MVPAVMSLLFVKQSAADAQPWIQVIKKSWKVLLLNKHYPLLLIRGMTTALLNSNLDSCSMPPGWATVAVVTPLTWRETKSLEQWMRGSEMRVRCSSKQEARRRCVGVRHAGPEASGKISACHQWGRRKYSSRYLSVSFPILVFVLPK